MPGGGQKKTEEAAAPPSPPPPPAVAEHEAEGKEKKGFLDKIKEKLPGYHSKTEEEKEKETRPQLVCDRVKAKPTLGYQYTTIVSMAIATTMPTAMIPVLTPLIASDLDIRVFE